MRRPPTGDSAVRPSSMRTARSQCATTRVVGDHEQRAATAVAVDRVGDACSALSESRCAVGSSRTTNGAREGRRARARVAGPGRPRAAAPVADEGLVPRGQRLDEAVSPSEHRRRPHPFETRVGSARRMFSATEPAATSAAAATTPSWRRQAPRRTARGRARPRGPARWSARARRRSTEAIVLFPAPLGPTSATVSPAASSRSSSSSDRRRGRPG